MTHRVLKISQMRDVHNIYVITKTICPPGYHRNDPMATHGLGHMMYGWLHIVGTNEPESAQQARQGA